MKRNKILAISMSISTSVILFATPIKAEELKVYSDKNIKIEEKKNIEDNNSDLDKNIKKNEQENQNKIKKEKDRYRITKGAFSFDESTGTITDYNSMVGGYNVIIPSSIDDIKVTTIGGKAFCNNRLTSVIIPNSVTTIEGCAFSLNELTNVIIPDSVTTIGHNAFCNNKLTSVTIPNSVTTIESHAFDDNELTSATIGDSVTTIGIMAFGHNNLTNITIGDSVTTIGDHAFIGNSLTSVTIPDSVTTIGIMAFSNNNLTSVTIPDSVTTISSDAFSNNFRKNVSYKKKGNKYIIDLKKLDPNIDPKKVFNVNMNNSKCINYDNSTGIITLDSKPENNTEIVYNYEVSNSKVSKDFAFKLYLGDEEVDNNNITQEDKAISKAVYLSLKGINLDGNIETDKNFDSNIKKSIVIRSNGQVKLEKNIENTDKYGNGYSGFKAILTKDDLDKIGDIVDGDIEIKVENNGETLSLPYKINPINSRMSTGFFDWESNYYKAENFPNTEIGKNEFSLKIGSDNEILVNNKVKEYGINLLAYYLNNDRYVFDLGIECGNFDISTEEHKNIFEVKDSNGNVVYTGNAVTFKDGAFPNLKPNTAVQIIVPVEYSTNDYNIELIVEDKNGVEQYRFTNFPKWN
ncbi:leucine-rich repeat domain-containing protein [Clostridium perfringens]